MTDHAMPAGVQWHRPRALERRARALELAGSLGVIIGGGDALAHERSNDRNDSIGARAAGKRNLHIFATGMTKMQHTRSDVRAGACVASRPRDARRTAAPRPRRRHPEGLRRRARRPRELGRQRRAAQLRDAGLPPAHRRSPQHQPALAPDRSRRDAARGARGIAPAGEALARADRRVARSPMARATPACRSRPAPARCAPAPRTFARSASPRTRCPPPKRSRSSSG